MENPFNTPSLWDVPLVQSFQSIAETVKRRALTGILQTFCLSHSLSHLFHRCLSPQLSTPFFTFSIFVFDDVFALSVLLRFAAPRDRMTKRSQTLHSPELPWKSLVQKKEAVFPADYHLSCFKGSTVHLIFLMGLKLTQKCSQYKYLKAKIVKWSVFVECLSSLSDPS